MVGIPFFINLIDFIVQYLFTLSVPLAMDYSYAFQRLHSGKDFNLATD